MIRENIKDFTTPYLIKALREFAIRKILLKKGYEETDGHYSPDFGNEFIEGEFKVSLPRNQNSDAGYVLVSEEELRKELAKRPHVPNKQERRNARLDKMKKKRNR